jgi:hypothetical protein
MVDTIKVGDSIELSEKFYRNFPALRKDAGKLLIVATGRVGNENMLLVKFPKSGVLWDLDLVKHKGWDADFTQFPCHVQALNDTDMKYIVNHYKMGEEAVIKKGHSKDIEFFFPNKNPDRDPNCPWEFL